MAHFSTHSVMFHHFHGERHLPAPGSLNGDQLSDMLSWLAENYSIIGAREYQEKLASKSLGPSEICLSFDDGLKCQFDIALPVLEKTGIQAFFFVYSSAFTDNPNPLEVYRLFRTSCFESVDDFYAQFFEAVEELNATGYAQEYQKFLETQYLVEFEFYSENDRWFRFLRNYSIAPIYTELMGELMARAGFDTDAARENLWMSEDDLRQISSSGHQIGLHSFSHPTRITALSLRKQQEEYQKNYDHLVKVTGEPITAASHPCGDYDNQTLGVLQRLGIQIGFRSNMSVSEIRSSLEVPREDHANVWREMGQ